MNKQAMARRVASRKIASGGVVYKVRMSYSEDTTWKKPEEQKIEHYYAQDERSVEQAIEKYYEEVAKELNQSNPSSLVFTFDEKKLAVARQQPSEGILFTHPLKTWRWGAIEYGQFAQFHITSDFYEDKGDLAEILKLSTFFRYALSGHRF